MNEQTEEVVAPVVEAPQYATIKRGVFVGANDRMCQVVDLGDIDNTGSAVTGIMIQRLGHKPQRIIMTQKMWDMLSEAMYLFSLSRQSRRQERLLHCQRRSVRR